jgi:single-strand DNA-binding protein
VDILDEGVKMASVNRVTLIGNLGADPELRYTPGGQPVCDLRLATSRKFKGKDGALQEDTQWHKVVIWGKMAETAKQYLAKGRSVYIEGRLQTKSWEDREGHKRWTTEVVAQEMQFLGNRGGSDNESRGSYNEPPAMPEDAPPTDFGTDDIPF